MASSEAEAPYGLAPELHQEASNATILNSLEASIDELIASIPNGPPPALPRKSSRRRLYRLNTQGLTTSSPSASPIDSVARSWGSHSHQSEDSKHSASRHRRWSSYSSVQSSPIEASSSSEPRTSTSSRTTWSDCPPDYDTLRFSTVRPELKRESTVLSHEEKEILRAEYPDEEADLERKRSLSLYSQADAAADLDVAPPSESSRTLFINAKGMPSFRLPLASKELEIQIVDQHGSVAYISSRSKRSSADASLSKPGLGEFVRTSYGRRTLLTCRQGELNTAPFTIAGSRLRRRQSFSLPTRGEFEWRYATTLLNGKREERLVLVQKAPVLEDFAPIVATPAPEDSTSRFSNNRLSRTFSSLGTPRTPAPSTEQRPSTSSGKLTKKFSSKAQNPAPRVLAQLSRLDQSLRGSGKKQATRAGMGGELVMEPGCTDVLPEEIVVATALVMMKKEQDRLRTVQAAVLVTILL